MKKLYATISATVIAFVALASQPTPREIPWIGAPKGICITNVVADANGVYVQFITDLKPPYRVGIHIPVEAGLVRSWPVDYVDTWSTKAFIPGRFLDDNHFVQVYKPDDTNACPARTAKMTASERSAYYSRRSPIQPARFVQNPTWYDDPPVRNDLRGIGPDEFELVGDRVWANFHYTSESSMHFGISMRNLQVPGSRQYVLNSNDFSCSVRGRDPSVGTGFRILVVETEDPETGDPAVACLAQAAYSARTNMSQAVLLKRGVYGLSAHGGWKYSVDWEGWPVMIPCTNAVPDKVYPEGL